MFTKISYHIPDTSANAITTAIKDCLVHAGVNVTSMPGCRTGVASQILSIESPALYTHFYGHSLNLAIV